MLDIGWMELMVVGIVALLVVGPKELPTLLRTIGRYVGMAKRQADQFRAQFDEAIRDSEFEDLKKEMDDLRSGRFADTDVGTTSKTGASTGKDVTEVDFEDDGPIEPAPEFRDKEETTSFTMADGTVVRKQETTSSAGQSDTKTPDTKTSDTTARHEGAAQEAHVNGSCPASTDGAGDKPADQPNRSDKSDGNETRSAETVR
jgi:sec-independent protein translocase protein TatB